MSIYSQTTWLLCQILIGSFLVSEVHSAPYSVAGMTLGEEAPAKFVSDQAYTCSAVRDLAGVTRCDLGTGQAARRLGAGVPTSFQFDRDKRLISISLKSTRPKHSDAAHRSEIDQLSSQFGGRPATSETHEHGKYAVWGDMKISEYPSHVDEYYAIAENKLPPIGLIADFLGSPQRSAKQNMPIYRLVGGAGVVHFTHAAANGEALVQIVAADGRRAAELLAEKKLLDTLEMAQARPQGDVSLWPMVAHAVRQLALDTSASIANQLVDRLMPSTPMRHYQSHVWSLVPQSVSNHLGKDQYWDVDIFGANTKNPKIRKDIIEFIDSKKEDPFLEILQYVIGNFDAAIEKGEKSPIYVAASYARAHSSLKRVLNDALRVIATADDYATNFYTDADDEKSKIDTKSSDPAAKKMETERNYRLNDILLFINIHPERYNSRPLVKVYSSFAEKTERILLDLQRVLKYRTSPHFDDATYLASWILFHKGEARKAIMLFPVASLAPKSDGFDVPDYRETALKQASRFMKLLPYQEQTSIIRTNDLTKRTPVLWRAAIRSAFLSQNYADAIKLSEEALPLLGVNIALLPISTDPDRISAALNKMLGTFYSEATDDIVYMFQASIEYQRLAETLKSSQGQPPRNVAQRVRTAIVKYSMLLDTQEVALKGLNVQAAAHKDFRHAIALSDLALQELAGKAQFAGLRSWAHYRRIRLLAVFAPERIGAAIEEFRRDYPKSTLHDDVLAEQVFAQAVIMRDMPAAERTFQTLLRDMPDGNAIDNAHSWMAIGYVCTGKSQDAQRMDREIMRRFPRTRHATYAAERISNPAECNRLGDLFRWERWSMQWRERTRVQDVIRTGFDN